MINGKNSIKEQVGRRNERVVLSYYIKALLVNFPTIVQLFQFFI
jgi:hypothetical protein